MANLTCGLQQSPFFHLERVSKFWERCFSFLPSTTRAASWIIPSPPHPLPSSPLLSPTLLYSQRYLTEVKDIDKTDWWDVTTWHQKVPAYPNEATAVFLQSAKQGHLRTNWAITPPTLLPFSSCLPLDPLMMIQPTQDGTELLLWPVSRWTKLYSERTVTLFNLTPVVRQPQTVSDNAFRLLPSHYYDYYDYNDFNIKKNPDFMFLTEWQQ